MCLLKAFMDAGFFAWTNQHVINLFYIVLYGNFVYSFMSWICENQASR